MRKLEEEKKLALDLRLSGMSYSQIKESVSVSKSTLSLWLAGYPLSAEKIYSLRGGNEQRIERCRNTKSLNRDAKLAVVYELAKKEIGKLSKREIFLAGLFLYWGEGTKASRDVVAFTNTDPHMMKFFVLWLESVGVARNSLKVKLHLYRDMDVATQITFWSKELGIPESNFWKPYIKKVVSTSLTYKKSFGQGTCSVHYCNAELYKRVMMGLKYIREIA